MNSLCRTQANLSLSRPFSFKTWTGFLTFIADFARAGLRLGQDLHFYRRRIRPGRDLTQDTEKFRLKKRKSIPKLYVMSILLYCKSESDC